MPKFIKAHFGVCNATGKASAWMMHLTLYLNGSSCFSQFITLWPVSFCPQAIVYVSINFNPDSIVFDFLTALIPAIQSCFLNSQIRDSVHRKLIKLGLRKKPVQEWMTDDRLPLWNVHNVRISTNDNLELWHNELNKKAGKSHVKFYELFQLLIVEQGVVETLINYLRVYQIYVEMQRWVVVYTSECTSGRRLLEQYLEVSAVSEDLMYLIPEVSGGCALRPVRIVS
ncbi:hypothetical protein T4D_3774 [Trichinella pseudospiralis]|uniref:Uncharacterized protein n=1 Tax=Trichinella pseudospiralis TaxID=6337 RepID=A0A0V1F4M0_TRIPS|nr:hypothetical protein T4D_3774 [Trichinella pseudospiralis]